MLVHLVPQTIDLGPEVAYDMDFCRDDSARCCSSRAFAAERYLAYVLMAEGCVEMSPSRIKKFVIGNYIAFVPFIPAKSLFATAGQIALKDQLCMGYRCILVVLYADSMLHLPAQFLLALAEIMAYLWANGWDEFALPCIFSQALHLLGSLDLPKTLL